MPSTCSSSVNISEQIDIYSYQVEPSTSSGSASIGDQIDPDACNSTCSSSANISEQIDIDSAHEELVNYEMEIPFEDLLLFEQQYIEGTNVEDPVFSQWIFLKSQLEHLEFLSQRNDLRKPVPAPSQVKLDELERNMPPGMKEKFGKRLAEGFDLDTDPLYSCWKQLKTSSSSSEHSIHSSPKPLRVPLAQKQINIPLIPKPVDVSPVFTSVLQKPSTVTSKSKYTPRTLNIPKHLSGEDFIALMEAKEKGKQEEKELKEARKREREEKKKERERDKLVKEEARKKKKEMAEKKRAEVAARKASIAAKKVVAKAAFTTRRNENKENNPVDPVRCYECGGREGDDDEVWIGCDTCENWAHLLCTDLDPELSSEDLEALKFRCSDCQQCH